MSMSTHVIGFAAPDEQWRKMKVIYDACSSAGVSIPDEVEKFFDGEEPDEAGVEVRLNPKPWSDDSRSGFEIDLSTVPKHVNVIRFYNSY